MGAGGPTTRQRIGFVVAGAAFVAGVLLTVVPFTAAVALPSGATIDVSCRAPVLEIYRAPWVTGESHAVATLVPAQVADLGDAFLDPTAACRLRAGPRLIAGATLVWLCAVILSVIVVDRRRSAPSSHARAALWAGGLGAIALSLALTWLPYVERHPDGEGVLLRCRGAMVVVRNASPVVAGSHGATADLALASTSVATDGTNRQCELSASRRIEVGGLVYWVGTYLVAVLLLTRRRRSRPQH